MFASHRAGFLDRIRRRVIGKRRSANQRQRCLALLGVELCEPRRLMAQFTWINPAGGAWNVASSWSSNATYQLPRTNDDVIIPDFATPITVSISTIAITVRSITANENLQINSGSLTVTSLAQAAGTFAMRGGTVSGTLTQGVAEVTGSSAVNTFTVAAGATLNVNASSTLQVRDGNQLTINGVGNFRSGSSISFGTVYNNTIVVNGTLNITNSTLDEFNSGSRLSAVYVNGAGKLNASNSTFNIGAVGFTGGAQLANSSLSNNTFFATLSIPWTDYRYLTQAGGGSNNVRYSTVSFQAGTMPSGGVLDLALIGTAATASSTLSYQFADTFTVGAGATLTVRDNMKVSVAAQKKLTISGTGNFNPGSVITLESTLRDTTLQVDGVLNVTSATIGQLKSSSAWDTFLVITGAGRMNATNSILNTNFVSLLNGATFTSGIWKNNIFDTTLTVPWEVIRLLSAGGGGENNVRFQTINILGGTMPAGQTLNLNIIGTDANANSKLLYVFSDNFLVSAGATLVVASNVKANVGAGKKLSVSGTASINSGARLTLDSLLRNTSMFVDGVLNVTSATITQASASGWDTELVISGAGQMNVTNSTISTNLTSLLNNATLTTGAWKNSIFDTTLTLPWTAVRFLSRAGGGEDNIRFNTIGISAGTVPAGSSLALSVIGTDVAANNKLLYLFKETFQVAASATLNIDSQVKVTIDPGVTVTINGTANASSGSVISLDSNLRNTTLAIGGVFNATGTTVTRKNNAWDTTLIINGAGRMNAIGSIFSITTIALTGGASFSSGIWKDNRFESTLNIPWTVIAYLSAAGGGENNQLFREIDIQAGTMPAASQLNLSVIGTDASANANLLYSFSDNFTVSSGAILNVGASVKTYLAAGKRLTIAGTANFGVNSSMTLDSNLSNTTLAVSGVLNTNATTITRANNASLVTLNVIGTGQLIGNNTTFPGVLQLWSTTSDIRLTNDNGLTSTIGNTTSSVTNIITFYRAIDVKFGSTFNPSALQLGNTASDPARFSLSYSSTMSTAGDVSGFSQTPGNFFFAGRFLLNKGSTSLAQSLEVMGADRGATASGFDNNYAIGRLDVGASTLVRLVNASRNWADGRAEAMYVGRLFVPAGSRLDLNGQKMYVRSALVQGTVTNGTLVTVPDEGPLLFGVPTPGAIGAGQTDTWTFTAPRNAPVAIQVNPGDKGSTAAFPSLLKRVRIELLNSSDVVLKTIENDADGNIVNLDSDILVAGQGYKIRVKAHSGFPTLAGNYVITLIDPASGETGLLITPDATSFNKLEGNSGSTEFKYNVTRFGDLTGGGTVRWTVSGTGVNPAAASDFQGGVFPSGTLTFTGATDVSKSISVFVNGDVTFENDESFVVTLSNPTGGAFITSGTASSVILNDDQQLYSDLVIEDVKFTDPLKTGELQTITWNERNAGAVSISGSWRTLVRAVNRTTGQVVFNQATLYTGNVLAPNGTAARIVQFSLPEGATAVGAYDLTVQVDSTNLITESNLQGTAESNNTFTGSFSVSLAPNPDLLVDSIALPTIAQLNVPFDVTWSVRNAGTASLTKAVKDRIYLSTDNRVDASDFLLADVDTAGVPLNFGTTATQTARVSVPIDPSIGPGNYRILIVTDAANDQFELDESNNLSSGTITVELPPLPDLVVTDITTRTLAVAGQTVQVSWTIKNQGTALAAGPWTDRVYLSSDSAIGGDLFLKDFPATIALAPGESVERTQEIQIPAGLSGNYRFVVATDFDNRVEEYNLENNNSTIDDADLVIDARPSPNLVVASVTSLTSGLSSGQSATLEWVVKNEGNAPTNTSSWFDLVYLSTDETISNDDVVLGQLQNQSALNVGDAFKSTLTVTLPENAVGPRYFIVKTDARNTVTETGREDDNTKASLLTTIALTPPPDLFVMSVEASRQAFEGLPITVSWTVVNQGSGPTRGSQWKDQIYLSLNGNDIDNSDILLQTVTHTGTLAVGEQYQVNGLSVLLPQYRTSDTAFIIVRTDATKLVYEHDFEGNNDTAEIDSTVIRLQAQPDLIVDSMVAPTLAIAGQPLPVTFRIKNASVAETRQTGWQDAVYLSTDAVFSPQSDLLLGKRTHLGGLAGDGVVQKNTNYSLPVTLSGSFFVIVVTDIDEQVFETSNDNNATASASPVSIIINPPDLRAQSLVPLSAAWAGRAVTVSYSVANVGGSPTPEDSWSDAFYLSTDSLLDASDRLLTQRIRSGQLMPGAIENRSISLQLPADLTGPAFLFVKSDSRDQVYELNNDNNIFVTPIAIGDDRPDLVVDVFSPRLGTRAFLPGSTLAFDYTVTNRGLGATYGSPWSDRLILSSDSIVGNNDDVLLLNFSNPTDLLPGQSYSRLSQNFKIPAAVADGVYRLMLVTDARGQVGEVNESNNVLISNDFVVSRSLNASQAPDLIVSTLNAPATANSGDALNLSWTIRNQGISATAVSTWRDDVWLSKDNVIDSSDIQVGRYYRAGVLAAGAAYSRSISWPIDINLSGDYFVLVESDVENQVFEGLNEDNNLGVTATATKISLGPTPDLQVTNVALPIEAFSGRLATIGWTVSNTGGKAAVSSWVDSVYLSLDQIFDRSSDIPLGFVNRNVDLAAGSLYSTSVPMSIPAGIGGSYYVFVVTDATNRLFERNGEANNVTLAASPLNITHLPPADLVVGSVTVPASSELGQSAVLSFTVNNQGQNPARGQWFDAVFLSNDDQWDIDDAYVGRVLHTGDIAAGGAYTSTLTAPLPGVLPGSYKVIVRSDIRNNIVESNEANNITASLNGFGIDVATLVLETPRTGTITKNGAVYYKVDVPAGETVVIEFDSAKTIGMTELYASFNAMPRRSQADLVALEPYQTDQRIVISNTEAGTYYIMAYGNDVEAGSSAFTITARVVPFTVFDTSYGQGGTAGNRTILISGAKFDRSVTAELVDAAGNAWPALRYTRASETRLYATFDLSDRIRGMYSVRLTKGATSEVVNVTNSLQVVFATISSQPVSLTRPDTFNRRRDDRPPAIIPVTVAWRNTTLNDIAVPWIHFSATDPFAASMEDARQGKLVTTTEFLGYARSDGPRDILLPGDFASADFFVQPNATTASSPPQDIYYVAEYFYEAAAARYPWDFDFSQLDLSRLSDDEAIDAINAFKQQYGSNVGALRQAMSDGLQRLGSAAPMDEYQASRAVLQDVFDRFVAARLTSITGQLSYNSLNVNYSDLVVTLTAGGGAADSYSTRVLADGSFVFAKLPAGSYEVRVTGGAVQVPAGVLLILNNGQHARVSLTLVPATATQAEAVSPRIPMGTASPAAPFVTQPGKINETLSGNVLESILPELQGVDYRIEIVGDAPQGFSLSSRGDYQYSSSQITAFVVHYDLILPDTITRVGRLFQNEIRSRGALAITLKNNFTRDVRALDPNDILGPAGYGDDKWVSSSERLNYTIRYENDPKNASSAAQLVNVIQVLDSDLDPRSVEFGSFGFGGRVFTVPPKRQNLNYDIDLRAEMGIFVRVFAFVDPATGEINWSFTSISPETGGETSNPEDGFLPLNLVRPEGDGFVSYSVKAKSSATSGSRLDAQARITFDGNVPIDTPSIFNTLDATRPVSAVAKTETIPDDGRLIVTWDGNDGEIGSGLSTFDIYVSENDGRFRPWLQQVDGLSAEYAALSGRSYKFVTIARDNVGNAELESKLPDSARPVANAGGPYTAVEGTTLTLQGVGVDPSGGTNLFYEWDLDYDGLEFNVDSTLRNPAIPVGDGPDTRSVALRVRVGSAQALASLVSTTTINTTNASPVLSNNNNAVSGFVYATLTNSGTWVDASGDTVFLTASLGSVVKNDNGSWTWTLVSSTPRSNETITITARDKDDGLSSISFVVTTTFNPATFVPSLTSTAASITSSRTVSSTLDFGAPVNDFVADDLITSNVSNVVINSLGNGRYTVSVTAQSTGPVSLSVRPGAVFDNQGRSNATINAVEWQFVDTTDMDFGDAPSAAQSGLSGSYPTLLSQNGAAHRMSSLRLGTAVDADQEGTPSVNADADDLAGLRDEDGIEFVMSILGGRGQSTVSTLIAHASESGKLDAWIDFNRDGDWNDAGEQIASSLALNAGANSISFAIPANAQAGVTYARFRISSAGGLAPTGQADDGEVEDYQVTIGDESLSRSLQLQTSIVGAHQVSIVDGRLIVSRGSQIFFQAAAAGISQLRLLGSTSNTIYLVLTPNTNLFGTVHFAAEGLPVRLTSAAAQVKLVDYVGAVLGIDTIEMTSDAAQSIVLSAASIDLLNTNKKLRIKSGVGDTIAVSDKLSYVTRFMESGELIHRFGNKIVTLELDNARDWYNSINPLDVNGDGLVTPIDALLIINQININNGSTRLPDFDALRPDAFSFMDVTGNGTLEPLDVLIVINRLNNPSSGEGESNVASVADDHPAAIDAVFEQADLWLLDVERKRKGT